MKRDHESIVLHLSAAVFDVVAVVRCLGHVSLSFLQFSDKFLGVFWEFSSLIHQHPETEAQQARPGSVDCPGLRCKITAHPTHTKSKPHDLSGALTITQLGQTRVVTLATASCMHHGSACLLALAMGSML